METKVSVLIKDPGKNPRHVNISMNPENLRKYVGDCMEVYAPCSDACFISSAAGYPGILFNFTMFDHRFYGPVIFVGKKDSEYSDVPISFNEAKKIFPEMFMEVEKA